MRQQRAEAQQREAGVAVINKGSSRSLNALTAAALCLPGLIQAPAQAAEEEQVHFQSGRKEARRAAGCWLHALPAVEQGDGHLGVLPRKGPAAVLVVAETAN